MTPRLNKLGKEAQGAIQAMLGLEKYVESSGLDRRLADLIRLRVSQINGCAFCIDMHWKDLVAAGEDPQRLYMLNAWDESPFYSERERAAFAWAEAVTLLGDGHVSDAVYEHVKTQFNESELVALTMTVVAINGWNRMNIAFRTTPGAYQPQASAAASRR
jgi:AhpD family alkylhydroperoxidase